MTARAISTPRAIREAREVVRLIQYGSNLWVVKTYDEGRDAWIEGPSQSYLHARAVYAEAVVAKAVHLLRPDLEEWEVWPRTTQGTIRERVEAELRD